MFIFGKPVKAPLMLAVYGFEMASGIATTHLT